LSHPVLAASLLANVGDFDPALAKYEAILAKVPDHAPLQTSYGHALKTAGLQRDCIAAYRKAIASDPKLGEAYWSLANLKTFRFEPVELDAMRELLEQADLGSPDRAHLCFGTACAWSGQHQPEF
jgi:tetratricopeptide (TPR) repeat protein